VYVNVIEDEKEMGNGRLLDWTGLDWGYNLI
jgi:hypothetical protein